MKPKKKNIQIKDILVCHLFEEKKSLVYHLKIILTNVIFFKKLIKHEVFQSLK